MTKTRTNTQPARQRFNGGFHDGGLAGQRGWKPEWQKGKHHDPLYEAGYWNGHALALAGGYDMNSTGDAAWSQYTAATILSAEPALAAMLSSQRALTTMAPGVRFSGDASAYEQVSPGRFVRKVSP